MTTPLNIKDPEAYQLASEIARKTGKTLTRVVVDALKREKEALRPAPQEIDISKLNAILARFDRRRKLKGRRADQIMNDLYDERGLPR
jgi:hypothetical protein